MLVINEEPASVKFPLSFRHSCKLWAMSWMDGRPAAKFGNHSIPLFNLESCDKSPFHFLHYLFEGELFPQLVSMRIKLLLKVLPLVIVKVYGLLGLGLG